MLAFLERLAHARLHRRAGRAAKLPGAGEGGTKGISKVFPKAVVAPATAESQPALIERLRVWIEDAAPSSIACAQRAMARRTDATPLLSGIRVPTLVIVGEEDPSTPPAEAEAIATAIHGAKLVRIPGAGHLSNMEQPEAFNAAVQAFVHGIKP